MRWKEQIVLKFFISLLLILSVSCHQPQIKTKAKTKTTIDIVKPEKDINIVKKNITNKNISVIKRVNNDIRPINYFLYKNRKDLTKIIKKTAVNDNIWQLIAANYSLTGYNKFKYLKWHIKWFVDNPDYLTRVTKRATPYLYLIFDLVKKNNIPYEIALLPIVESAFDPFAHSYGSAAGLWQFIPSTAKLYGLQQNFWIDERRDIIKSTKAAIKYLKNLNKLFKGDWLLAIAAYNSGPGRVQKAIKKNKKLGKATDFWHLNLPVETMGYVPRLLAVAELIKYPHLYYQTITKINNKKIVNSVTLDSQLDLALIVKWSTLNIDEIYKLNPALNKWATPYGIYNLLLPVKNITRFKYNLLTYPKNNRVKWLRHKIIAGDSIIKLAKKYNISVNLIKKINKLAANKIILGKYLIIPVALKQNIYYHAQQKSPNKKYNTKITYVVKKDDTLWAIAKKYQTSVNNLVRWNKLSSKTKINIGDKFIIWQQNKLKTEELLIRTKIQSFKIKKISYTIKDGDNLSSIANKFNTSSENLIKLNNIDIKKVLKIGEKIQIQIYYGNK